VWADEDGTCDKWEPNVKHAPVYLVDENGRTYEKENG